MKMIFNHLLFRMYGQAIERITILQREREIIERWTKESKEEKVRLSNQVEYGVNNLLRGREIILSLLKALEESRPSEPNPEQQKIIDIVKKTFTAGLHEYQSLVRYAIEVGFDRRILEGRGLGKDQGTKQSKKQKPEEREDEE